MTLEFSRQIFKKSSNIKLNENPSRGSAVVPCAQKDGQTDMTNLIVAFCNFANAPKIFSAMKLRNNSETIYL